MKVLLSHGKTHYIITISSSPRCGIFTLEASCISVLRLFASVLKLQILSLRVENRLSSPSHTDGRSEYKMGGFCSSQVILLPASSVAR
jgi:hypothetical protein